MIQRVDTVLIGKKANVVAASDLKGFAEGDVVVFNENRMPIAAADAAKATTLYIGVIGKELEAVKKDGTVEKTRLVDFSNPIKKDSKPRMHVSAYTAPEQEVITIDLANATVVAGHRYVLRIVYKDIEGAPGQFTHTYEHVATTNVATDVLAALLKKINKHANRRVTASVSGSTMTLTAMAKTDNEGVNSLNEYSIVNMEATVYETIPGQLLNNNPEDFGAVIRKNPDVVATPGVGYWKQVRDQEVRNMGYKGLVYTGAFPALAQDMKTVEGAEYNVITIENDNLYLSNDNQYIKTTPMVAEVYVPGEGYTTIATALKNFGVVELNSEKA
jgi:hypothetical protein